jgi:hypothetical protein
VGEGGRGRGTEGRKDVAEIWSQELQSHNQQWSTVGRFLAFDRIVEEEGGATNPDNVQAAVFYCRRCLEIGQIGGSPFVVFDSMTNRLKFKYIEVSQRDDFNRTWTTKRRWQIEDGRPENEPMIVRLRFS